MHVPASVALISRSTRTDPAQRNRGLDMHHHAVVIVGLVRRGPQNVLEPYWWKRRTLLTVTAAPPHAPPHRCNEQSTTLPATVKDRKGTEKGNGLLLAPCVNRNRHHQTKTNNSWNSWRFWTTPVHVANQKRFLYQRKFIKYYLCRLLDDLT